MKPTMQPTKPTPAETALAMALIRATVWMRNRRIDRLDREPHDVAVDRAQREAARLLVAARAADRGAE